MVERKSVRKSPKNTATSAPAKGKGFTDEERLAMKERAKETKAARSQADEERAVLQQLAAMPEPDRSHGTRLHAIVKANAPELTPKLWYGMPAYAKDGQVLCFFQSSQKFKTRYSTFGFSDKATLDDGALWPVAFAVKKLDAAAEASIAALVKKAVR